MQWKTKKAVKPYKIGLYSSAQTIRTRPWNFFNILKVPVFYRYLQVQIPKKATFRIQI